MHCSVGGIDIPREYGQSRTFNGSHMQLGRDTGFLLRWFLIIVASWSFVSIIGSVYAWELLLDYQLGRRLAVVEYV